MDFFEVIEKRYSVRGYKNQEVEKEKLDKILEAARLAPTGVNKQPFKIFVIDTKKHKEELNKIYKQPWFTQAPVVLCIAADKTAAWTRPWDGKNISDIDATIVMDHIILSATALGLGTCYIAAFKKNEVIKFLNLEEKYEPLLFTPIGYIDAEPRDTPRKSIDELVEFI